ncbi:alpha-hydroxy-acid oxidizing protein [uncultured Piscinibacter sp.]|uniref:alpha-hydroxy-acid oxidizing protein n=1 Tax=uncultured Piscinibacter sp. TaxID=1131835 RepID=UPI0026324866|nr:alpha-hydroxy-acid oxidizing protein [uncultured Piscinibacter sp.]
MSAKNTAGIVSLADYEAQARQVLDDGTWTYLCGGAADERTLRANREAWASSWLHSLAQGHMRIELLGRTLAHPILVAPVAWQRLAHTRLPLLLKGALHPDDARLARQHAVDGLIVSNHGGRTLDTALPTAWALPRLSDAVGDALPLLVDGGIRRGTDVLKAIALGARAVLVGRPIVQALAVAGAHGVAHALRLLRDEVEIAMVLSGVAELAEVHREMLFDAPRSALGAPWERPR